MPSADSGACVTIAPEHLFPDHLAVPTADYADLVMVANLQLVAGTEHPWTDMDWNRISAFDRLGLDPNIYMGEEEDLSAQMEAAMALLK